MRVRTLPQVTRDWIGEACWLYCVDTLPERVRKRAWLSCIGNLRLGNRRQARLRVFSIIGHWVETDTAATWFDFVKPPLPAFLQTRGED